MLYIKNNRVACLGLAALLATPSVFGANIAQKLGGDPVAGKVKAHICQGCHGVDGNSSNVLIPKLSGQYEVYIAKQMRNYMAGTRSHELMNGMAAPLSDKDVDDISAYFAGQPAMKGSGATPNEKGENLYLKGKIADKVMTCVYCHGEGGKGLTPETGMYPVVGGQHKAYLLKQLIDFKNDDRLNSPNIIMNKTLRSLSDRELDALADYMSVQ